MPHLWIGNREIEIYNFILCYFVHLFCLHLFADDFFCEKFSFSFGNSNRRQSIQMRELWNCGKVLPVPFCTLSWFKVWYYLDHFIIQLFAEKSSLIINTTKLLKFQKKTRNCVPPVIRYKHNSVVLNSIF